MEGFFANLGVIQMSNQINDLVKMHDSDTLFDLMNDSDDQILQLDAAEGLVKLGDGRGLDLLLSASQSEYKDVAEYASEILDSPEIKQMQEQIEADQNRLHQEKVLGAKERLRVGKKVYAYKMVYIPSGDILQQDVFREGYNIPDLDEAGMEGWEVASVILRRGEVLIDKADTHIAGAYFLMKREISPDESAKLDEI